MKKLTFLILVIIAGMCICSFTAENPAQRINIANTSVPFPQTGVIKVYKYRLFNKEEIGELRWTATTERKYDSKKEDYYSIINITIENTTNEYVSFSFDFKGVQNGYASGEVSPHGTWRSGALYSGADCTGVVPNRTEITLS